MISSNTKTIRPPSSAGIGSKLLIPRNMLISAHKIEHQPRPFLQASLQEFAANLADADDADRSRISATERTIDDATGNRSDHGESVGGRAQTMRYRRAQTLRYQLCLETAIGEACSVREAELRANHHTHTPLPFRWINTRYKSDVDDVEFAALVLAQQCQCHFAAFIRLGDVSHYSDGIARGRQPPFVDERYQIARIYPGHGRGRILNHTTHLNITVSLAESRRDTHLV